MEILQQRVSNDISGEVNGVQSSIINMMNVLQFATTIIFYDPAQFLYPTLFSCFMVLTGATIYTTWVRIQRGHLFHFYTKKYYEPLKNPQPKDVAFNSSDPLNS
jgi:iron-regulated transporter 1